MSDLLRGGLRDQKRYLGFGGFFLGLTAILLYGLFQQGVHFKNLQLKLFKQCLLLSKRRMGASGWTLYSSKCSS